MPRGEKHGVDNVIAQQREAEVMVSRSQSQELAAKAIEVSAQTLIRWRKEYGGLAGRALLRPLGQWTRVHREKGA